GACHNIASSSASEIGCRNSTPTYQPYGSFRLTCMTWPLNSCTVSSDVVICTLTTEPVGTCLLRYMPTPPLETLSIQARWNSWWGPALAKRLMPPAVAGAQPYRIVTRRLRRRRRASASANFRICSIRSLVRVLGLHVAKGERREESSSHSSRRNVRRALRA